MPRHLFRPPRARALAEYPGVAPQDLASAYRIQDAAIRLDGRAVAGWKVGRIFPPLDSQLGANRLSGPVFADEVVSAANGEVPAMPVFAGGFAAGEAELLLHVAPGWNGEVPSDDAGTRAILDEVRLGIEVASSPYPRINADGPLVTVSDFGNNHGVVMGPVLDGWRELDLCAIVVRTEVAGETVGEATAATCWMVPMARFASCLAISARADSTCRKGCGFPPVRSPGSTR